MVQFLRLWLEVLAYRQTMGHGLDGDDVLHVGTANPVVLREGQETPNSLTAQLVPFASLSLPRKRACTVVLFVQAGHH
jgi:hypothetical protein